MKISRICPTSLFVLGSSTCAYGWIIDDSCTRLLGNHVETAVRSAGRWAQNANDALAAQPWSQDTTNFYSYLFPTDGQGRPTGPGVRDRVASIIQQVGQKVPLNSQPGNNRNDQNEIIIFCDYSRVVPPGPDDPPGDYDPAYRVYLEDDDDYEQCKSTSMDVSPLAYTMKATTDTESKDMFPNVPPPPTVVQLCPWFVTLMKNRIANSVFETRPTRKNFAAYLWIVGRLFPNVLHPNTPKIRQIDIFALLDHVIFHELTHARGIDTVDEGGFPNAYFWQNVNANKGTVAYGNNADSIAYFAQAIDLRVNKGTTVKLDGSLEPSRSLIKGIGVHQRVMRVMRKLLWRA